MVCRYIVIVHPMKSRSWCTTRSTYKTIAIVWIIALLLSSPTLHIMVNFILIIQLEIESILLAMICHDNDRNMVIK